MTRWNYWERGMLEHYFNVVTNMNNVSTVESFLAKAEDILKSNKGDLVKINQAILNELMPDSWTQGWPKNIITMWYMGSWMDKMVSPQSYTQGLIWNTMETHPPGAKQPG